MRQVKVYAWDFKGKRDGNGQLSKKLFGSGTFHQFGVDYEELEGGPGMFTTAIVEMPDGSVANVPVELIEFVDGTAGEV